MTNVSTSEAAVSAAGRPRLHGVRAAALTTFRALGLITVVAVVVEIVFAGLGAFGASFEAHRVLGGLIPVPVLLMLVAILVARPSWIPIGLTVLLLVLTAVVQPLLGSLGDDTNAWFGGVHALDALVILGLAGRLSAGARNRGGGDRAG